jgi:PAS domain S-box-containing protein
MTSVPDADGRRAWSAYLAAMQDGFFVVDDGGVVAEVNQRLADILRSATDDLLGSRVPYPWWPVDDPVEFAKVEIANRTLTEKGAGEFDLVFRRADGTHVPVIVAAATVDSPDDGGTRYVCTVKDVGERRIVEQERDGLLARLDALLEHAPAAFAFVDRQLRFTRVNQPMADLVGVPIGDHIGQHVDAVDSELWRQAEAGFRAVLETGDAVMDVELEAQTAIVPGLERAFLASYYPVRATDGSLLGAGALLVEITERKQFERGAYLVLQASELVATTHDLDEILAAAVALPVPSFADSCHVYLDTDRDWTRRVAIEHVVPGLAERLLAADERWPLSAEAVLDPKEPNRAALLSVVDDAMREGFVLDDDHRAIIQAHGVVSALAAPLVVRGRRIGLLLFNYTTASGRRYRTGDLRLAEEVARRYAQALDAARLAARERRVQAQLDLLARAGDLVTVELSVDTRLRSFVSLAVPDFADVCMVHERQDDGSLALAHFALANPHLVDRFDVVESRLDVVGGPIRPVVEAFESGAPVLVPEITDGTLAALDASRAGIARELGVRSLLCVPMIGDGGELLGVVAYLQARSGRRFDRSDVVLAQELVRRASFAIEHARRFEREQTTAVTLQRSLLPAELPRIGEVSFAARYRPGSEALRVGGDWYDVIPRADGRVLFAVGDVVGHGLRAASSTGRLRAAVQMSALDGHGAASTLERLNRYLCSLPDAAMATVVVALLDPATGELTFASAGHPPPLLLRADGGADFLTGGLGVPLHVTETATYREATTALAPDDVVVVYTDGLVERRDESLDVGLQRLLEVGRTAPLELEELADHLLDAMLPQPGPTDDVALLLLRSTRRPMALELRVPARPEELARVRRRLRAWLDEVGADAAQSEELTVAVHEAAANVVEHAYGLGDGPLMVGGRRSGDLVEIEVRDSGRWRSRAPRPQRGRGFSLMRSLADSVDVEQGASGTTVVLRRDLGLRA